ncbi:MAG TPA: hypothetical protein VN042_04565 [Asticcacaulis sp.]|jgi:hypothetical protein|nr:hypothetical protein [Asticcacaulis sp.]
MLLRLGVFILQFVITLLTLIVGAAVYLLSKHGLSYRLDPGFMADMNLFTRVALVVTIILFLVIICYRATRDTLQQ